MGSFRPSFLAEHVMVVVPLIVSGYHSFGFAEPSARLARTGRRRISGVAEADVVDFCAVFLLR